MSTNQESLPTRHAWKVLLGLFALILFLGIGEFRQGQSGDPGMVEAISGTRWTDLQDTSPGIASLLDVETRIIGALWAGLGLIGAAVSFTGFRRRQKWAWWSVWALPLVMALILGTFLTAGLVPGTPTPPAMYSAPFTIIVASTTLLLSIRTFFPGRDRYSEQREHPVGKLPTAAEDGGA
jgi:hypothetical protein